MFAARVLLRASLFNVRTSFVVQVRLRFFIPRLLDHGSGELLYLIL